MNRFAILFAVLLTTSTASAEFGTYQSHEVADRRLVITSELGELRITAVDDAAFEVHYIQTGKQQLPSFALAPTRGDVVSAVAETDTTLSIMVDGLTAEQFYPGFAKYKTYTEREIQIFVLTPES